MHKMIAMVAALVVPHVALAQSAELPELPSGLHCSARGLAPHYLWDYARTRKDGPALFFAKLELVGVECRDGPTTHRFLGVPSFSRSELKDLAAAIQLAKGFSDLGIGHTEAAALVEHHRKEVAVAKEKAAADIAARQKK